MEDQAKNVHNYQWRDAVPPDLQSGRTMGRLRSCEYCGSMHPADVAAAIRAGAKGEWADRKYGWPHKAYFDGIPNPHAGLLESTMSRTNPPQEEIDAGKWIEIPTGRFDERTGKPTTQWAAPGTPASHVTYGKFYSEHLQDASPEDRSTIEQHLGLHFEFLPDGNIRWWKFGTDGSWPPPVTTGQ